MRKLLIAVFALSCNVSAQVINIDCPKSYPPKASALEVAPPGHKGRALVPPASPLEDWSLFDGEFGEPAQIHAGESTRAKGGTDTKVPPIRWFVCYYRGGISWWEETGAEKAADQGRIKDGCAVQTRDNGKSFRLVCK